MIAKVNCFSLNGLDGIPVAVETDINRGVPSYEMVGLPDAAVKESKERVRSAIKNSGYSFPLNKITVNFAPADVRKEGASFDLAIAVSLLMASGQLEEANLEGIVFLGELGLNGEIRPVGGLLPILISAKNAGFSKFIISKENEKEARFLEGAKIYPAENLGAVIKHLLGAEPIPPLETVGYFRPKERSYSFDMRYVKGQPIARRALEIAAAGGHNLLMIGPPGTGKTMLARCIPSILPDLTFEEALEITKIHSVAGILGQEGIVTERPFRTPHHTASTVSLCGGGNRNVHPGEISLAHGGVLFLDELPEYNRSSLEALRQPLEDGCITISRAAGSVTFPSRFILCASMNPCPCGNFGSKKLECNCSPAEIRRYRKKVSGPLLDRIDLQVEVDNLDYEDIVSEEVPEDSETVKERVNRAREVQRERFHDAEFMTNAGMGERQISLYCPLDEECDKLLHNAFERLSLSARARARIIKVARTIADLDGKQNIERKHLFEAVSYRLQDRF